MLYAGNKITAHTSLLALVGHPVRHSLSPLLHNAALRSQGVDMVYVAFDVEPSRLSYAVMGLKALGARGANVTLPHKENVIGFMDSLDPLAARVGSVNTIVNDKGHFRGYNTDVAGFIAALRTVRPEGALGAQCLVAGAGGAARAVVAGLMADGAAGIRLYNRTSKRAEQLCAAAEQWGACACVPVTGEELAEVARHADVLVNATSVGLGTSVKDSALPVDIVDSHHVVMDLVYGVQRTALIIQAEARGAATIDGRKMLVMQGASAYRLWTGLDAPIDVMEAAISTM